MRRNINILIVDDEPEMREPLGDILKEEGYQVVTVEDKALAQKKLKENFFNIVLADLMLPDGTGLDLLEYIKKTNDETMVIVLTGFASLETSIQAINAGAFSYIQKPVNVEEVKMAIRKALKVQKLSLDNKMLLEKLKELSLKDLHTNLYNYHYFLERVSSELKRAKRYILPLSVIMIDIDHFKAINDVYGHTYGDIILKELAQCLSEFARGNDFVARYGGEEFVILLPDTNKEGALVFGKRLWEEIGNHTFDPEGRKTKIKVSLGVASYPEDGADEEGALLKLVDQALHEAKERGGNRISTPKRLKIDRFEETIIRRGGEEDVKRLKNKLFKLGNRVNRAMIEAVYAFARAVEVRDHYTVEHVERIASLSIAMGMKLGLPKKDVEDLEHAAVLHDLGKVGIDNKILDKKGKLTPAEFRAIKKHPQIGAEIIRQIHFLEAIIPLILYHHERFDGRGYLEGLKDKDIPLGARIIALADAYEALVSDRPYRKAYSREEALDIIKEEGKGTQFDPEIADIFLEIESNRNKKNRGVLNNGN